MGVVIRFPVERRRQQVAAEEQARRARNAAAIKAREVTVLGGTAYVWHPDGFFGVRLRPGR